MFLASKSCIFDLLERITFYHIHLQFPLFPFNLLNSWRRYVFGVVLALVVIVAVVTVGAVVRDLGLDIVVVVLGILSS